MEKDIMYSSELIRKMPKNPTRKILFVVYDDSMIKEAEQMIAIIQGRDYLFDFVTVTSFDAPFDRQGQDYSVYIDPMVFKYKHSWND